MNCIYVFVPYFYPGYKGGGPIKTVGNMVSALSSQYSFHVLCEDRDLGDSKPYDLISRKSVNVGCEISYIRNSILGYWDLTLKILKHNGSDYHFNSLFSFKYSIFPLFIVWLKSFFHSQQRIILGPRGELDPGALLHKKLKKTIFIKLAKKLPQYKNICWHCSSQKEVFNVKRNFGANVTAMIAIDIADALNTTNPTNELFFKPGNVIGFISRITPKKNLKYAINLIAKISRPCTFRVAGPIEDREYWDLCLSDVKKFKHNVAFEYVGVVSPVNVPSFFSSIDLFFFPTHGENFGHVIWESISNGVPVLTSDMTPWHQITKFSAGAEYPLDSPGLYLEYLNNFLAMSNEARIHLKNKVINLAHCISVSDLSIDEHLRMFKGIYE